VRSNLCSTVFFLSLCLPFGDFFLSDYHAINAKAERRLVRKLDCVILPLAVLLYLAAYLDRGNLGNARLQGLQEEVLRGSDTGYSIALSCFFITYIVFSIPGTLLAKAVDPSRYLHSPSASSHAHTSMLTLGGPSRQIYRIRRPYLVHRRDLPGGDDKPRRPLRLPGLCRHRRGPLWPGYRPLPDLLLPQE
jgi:hypothetical protein